MAKMIFIHLQPDRINCGPIFGVLFGGVLFVFAVGGDDVLPELVHQTRWHADRSEAEKWLKRFLRESLKAPAYAKPRTYRPGDEGPTFKAWGLS